MPRGQKEFPPLPLNILVLDLMWDLKVVLFFVCV